MNKTILRNSEMVIFDKKKFRSCLGEFFFSNFFPVSCFKEKVDEIPLKFLSSSFSSKIIMKY